MITAALPLRPVDFNHTSAFLQLGCVGEVVAPGRTAHVLEPGRNNTMRRALQGTTVIALLLCGAAIPQAQSSGALNFARTDTPSVGAPRTIVSADFNRDGFPDVALGGTARASIGIMYHHGLEDGDEGQRFKPLQEIVVGGGPFDLAAADLNRDGWPDIAVANADSDSINILLNLKQQQFAPPLNIPASENPRGIAVGDFNRDGTPDLVVSKYRGSTIEILYGAGDGTFPSRRSYPAPPNVQGLAVADFNRDNVSDIVAASVTGVVAFYYVANSGTVTRQDVRPGSDGWNVVTAGDFDQDGKMDAAVASYGGSVVQVLTRSSSGQWMPSAPVPVAASPRGIETADMNQDGVLDLAVAGRAASTVTVLTRQADGSYARTDVAAGSGARDLVLTRFEQSGKTDILTADEFGSSTTLLANTSDFRPPPGFGFQRAELPAGIARAIYDVTDFNGNGKPDLLRSRDVLLDSTTVVSTGNVDRSGAAGDFDRNGCMDIVYGENPNLRIYWGTCAGGFISGPATATGMSLASLRTADFNRDAIVDIATTAFDSTTQVLDIYLGRGDGSFTRASRTTILVSRYELTDVNRDGVVDLVGLSRSGITTLIGDGAGGWTATRVYDEATRYFAMAVGDMTSDDIPDLVLAPNDRGNFGHVVTIARGQGDGTFAEFSRRDTADPEVFTSGINSLVLADLDLDGMLDVFTGNGKLLAGQYGLGEPMPFGVYTYQRPIAADMNQDGLTDLLGMSPNDFSNPILMLNTRTSGAQNQPPGPLNLPDRITWNYATYWYMEDESGIWPGFIADPELHAVRYRWTMEDGTVLSRYRDYYPTLPPGEYPITITVDDYRGASASDTFTLVVTPFKEMYLFPAQQASVKGAWQTVADPTAAEGYRLWIPNANAPKLQSPLANPTNYFEVGFLADPTQEYKLWIRLKAEGDHWANDSVYVQFTGARDAAGNPMYEIGTTSALAVNLEECSGCGISGWGWEDDGWGAVNVNGRSLRFPQGGPQTIRVQVREDGVSLDQIVLSSEKYRTARPGTAKNDTTKLPNQGPWLAPYSNAGRE